MLPPYHQQIELLIHPRYESKHGDPQESQILIFYEQATGGVQCTGA